MELIKISNESVIKKEDITGIFLIEYGDNTCEFTFYTNGFSISSYIFKSKQIAIRWLDKNLPEFAEKFKEKEFK